MLGREKRVQEVLTAFALFIAVTTQLTACLIECERTLWSELESPDGRYVASISDGDCGATGGSHLVQLASIGEDGEPGRPWTIFSMPGVGFGDVAVHWESETELFITMELDRPPGTAFRRFEMGDGTVIVIDYNRHWPGVPDNRPIPSFPPIESD